MSRTYINPNEFNAQRAVLAAEIAALTGASAEVAGIAAGSLLAFPHGAAQNYGLNDPTVGNVAAFAKASVALGQYLAAQAKRVAA